ncbi:MAG: M28 family peptidase [Anaerolineales bacterium]|nr:M28 family peptidase [Anaerolineales bacterium]
MPSTAMQHIRHLSESLGPRGATTPAEKQAAEYARTMFEALGLETHLEEFKAPVTGWRQYTIASLISLVCLALFWFGGQIGALAAGIVQLFTGVSVLLEASFIPNPLTWLIRKGTSQNVWARVPARGPVKRRILILGHLDTQRTPWAFTSPKRLTFFRLMTTLSVVAFLFSAVLYLVLAFVDFAPLRWLTLILVPVFGIVLGLTWQPDTTPFTHGANDNASGASIVLSLAGHLAQAPLEGVEVWALCTGCEEVGAHGTQAFLRKHRADLPGLSALNFDNVGGRGAGICTITVEGMVLPQKPSPELLALVGEVRDEHPDWNAYSKPFTTLGTDGTCLMINKVPTLSFVGLTPEGILPNWHQASDTFEKVDPATVEAVEVFALEMLRRI